MQRPYQCLRKSGNILVAASISSLDTFNLENGKRISSWDYPLPTGTAGLVKNSTPTEIAGIGARKSDCLPADIVLPSDPPTKRRKLSNSPTTEENEFVDQNKQKISKPTEPANPMSEAPAIIALTSTRDGKHVIAVTGEDKTIRVFEHDGKGGLHQTSERAMPKRPCAIAITTDDQTIICADKFGDVYSLPLVPSLLDISNMGQAEEKYLTHSVAAKPFISAANDLTIHTARNRKALQNQMRQNQKLPEKTEPKFEHKLLLGHVSMLTDLVVAERQSRNYIITADRDEHIRVSRGIPQAHIIENYCLGHEDFITRLCLPTPFPELLLSGGGDDAIYVWDFLSGRVLFRGSLRPHVETLFPEGLREIDLHPGAEVDSEIESVKIAVSSIRFLDIGVSNHGFVVVICEGIPALFLFSLAASGEMIHSQTLGLNGNPLAVEADGVGKLIVSVDCLHKPASTKLIRSGSDLVRALQRFEIKNSEWVREEKDFDFEGSIDIVGNVLGSGYDRISGILYGLENLRKRGGED